MLARIYITHLLLLRGGEGTKRNLKHGSFQGKNQNFPDRESDSNLSAEKRGKRGKL